MNLTIFTSSVCFSCKRPGHVTANCIAHQTTSANSIPSQLKLLANAISPILHELESPANFIPNQNTQTPKIYTSNKQLEKHQPNNTPEIIS